MERNLIIVGVIVVILGGGLILLNTNSSDVAEPEVVVMEDLTPVEEVMAEPNLVEVAVGTPSVSTLVTAVTAAGLVETLQGEGPFTVFAPVNEAFAALPAETVDTLLMPENIADLQSVLTYHVVPGAVMAAGLTDGMVVTTVNGQELAIGVAADGTVSINGSATVIAADVAASNGVIHLIDSVLLPAAE